MLAFLRTLLRERRRVFVVLVVLNGLAAATGLVVPRLLGSLINRDRRPATPRSSLNSLALLIVAVVCAQALLTFLAQRTSTIFGQDLLSSAREYIVRTILSLPLGRVESASSGDLVTRVTRDVGTMSRSVQYGVPMAIISGLTVVLSIVAMLLNSVLLAVPSLLVIGLAYPQVRRYLQRAPKGYINEGATYSRINSTLTETVEGARTVEALGLADRRVQAGDDDIDISAQAERYTMTLRNLLFAVIDVAFNAPRVVTLLVGAYGYCAGLGLARPDHRRGALRRGAERPARPAGRRGRPAAGRRRLDEPAARHRRGAARPRGRRPTCPTGPDLVGEDLRFAYREGHDVLHGVDLRLRTGERLAIVGPCGSGKSTLGRLLSGINGPRTGSVTVGGVELVDAAAGDAAHRGRAGHPGAPRVQGVGARQHHPGPRGLRRRGGLGGARARSARPSGSRRFPTGLDTQLGSGNQPLTPAQAQQIALARLIIADPHTLVLDEATSLIDPRTARTLEGSMNALLAGRTVVAIAHRLHTAHDADRIAVVIDGRIVELGTPRGAGGAGRRVRRALAGLDVLAHRWSRRWRAVSSREPGEPGGSLRLTGSRDGCSVLPRPTSVGSLTRWSASPAGRARCRRSSSGPGRRSAR